MTRAVTNRRIAALLGPYSVLRGKRSLSLVFGGQVVSAFGDRIYIIVVLVMAFNLTQSATVVALLNLMRLLPNAVVLPLGGWAADRIPPRVLMIGADAGRFLCMLGLLAADSRATLWIAFPLVFLTSCLLSFFRPALNAALPGLAGNDEQLIQANSVMSQVDALAWVIAPGIAGLLVLVGDLRIAFLLNAGTYLISIVALLFVRVPVRPVDTRPKDEVGWLSNVLAGFHFVFRENEGVLGAVTIPYAGFQIGEGAWWTLLVVLTVDVWHFGNGGVGFISACYGLGGLIGGFAAGAVARKIHPGVAFAAAVGIRSVLIILFGISPSGALPFGLLCLVGIADVMALVLGVTIIQTASPRSLLARSFGAFESTSLFAKVAGTLIAGPLIVSLGARAGTVVLSVVALSLLLPCIPRLRRLQSVVELHQFLYRVPMLAELTRTTLDELALHLRLERVPDNSDIVRQHEIGDKLYFIKSGEAMVLASNDAGPEVQVAELHAMDYFGEIALLHDSPRTATVRAKGPVEVFSLARADFQTILERSEAFRADVERAGEARYLETQATLLHLR